MSLGKTLKKAFKSVTKAAVNVFKSSGKAIENAVSGTAKMATGDFKGAVKKFTNMAANAGNVASAGTVDLTNRKSGVVNINTSDAVDAVLGTQKDNSAIPMTQTTENADSLAAYVADTRQRQRRRSRASTNNKTSTAEIDRNRLSGISALGV